MPALGILLCGLGVVAGLWFAVKFLAGPLDWFFGLVWKPRYFGDRAEMAKRVKELCVDGKVPEETAVMMAAREANVTERELLECLDAVSPSQLKAILSGHYGSAFSWEKMFKGKGRGR